MNVRKYSVMKHDFHTCPIYHVLIVTEINDVTDSQIMQYFGILDGIALYPSRIMKQWWTDEEL